MYTINGVLNRSKGRAISLYFLFKKIILFLFFLIVSNTAYACDICGCFMGVLPYDNQSSVAFMHRYRVFNGYHHYQSQSHYFPNGAYRTMHGSVPHDSVVTRNYSSADYESYKIYELRGKYFIHERVELNAFVSLSSNKSKEDTLKFSHTGLSDPSFFVGYHIVRPKMDKDLKQRWLAGIGLKLPSGNFYAKDESGRRLPFLIQPGTGSVDYFFYSTYMIAYKKAGISTTLSYKVNGENYYEERLGNSVTNFSSVFFKFKTKNWLFMPSLNSYYEFTNGLFIRSVRQLGTNMNDLMCGVGMDVFFKNYGLSLGAQKTVKQDTEDGQLNSVGRIYATLSYNFNQRKYLFKGKD